MAKLYGKGTIREIERGKKYHITLSCGKNPVTGKYDRYTETFLGTKRQAELRVEEIRRELESGKAVNADRITLAEWVESYLEERRNLGTLRPNTIKTEGHYAKHIVSRLGAVRLADLAPMHISAAYAAMRSDGVGDTTVYQCHKMLKAILRRALDNDLINRNPADRVQAPRKPKPKRGALDPSEADRFAETCAGGKLDPYKVGAFLALATGARLGEVLGLTWRNVSSDGGRPYVHLSRQYTTQGELAPLKTDSDDNPTGRIVPIDSVTLSLLDRWSAEQRARLNVYGIEQGRETPIVSNEFGGFMDHHNYARGFRGLCASAGFGRWVIDDGREVVELRIGDDPSPYPPDSYLVEWRDAGGWPCDPSGKRYSRTNKRPKVRRHYEGLVFHELRHTHFTIRLAAGMDIPTAQALGGWSTPSMLLNVYAHPVAENIWNSAGFMDRLTTSGKAAKGGVQ